MTDRNTDRSRLRPWMPLVIAAAGIAVYLGTLGHPFIFDDEFVIVRNPRIGQLWPITLFTRWVVDFSFRLNVAVGGLRPADFRAVNLLIHIGAGWLLYGIVRRSLLLARFRGAWCHLAVPVAGLTALLWVVHPLQTASVAYICQRYESLMGLCYLGALYAFVRGAQGRREWFYLSILICLLGMGTKEVMATAPAMLLLYDAVIVAEPGGLRRRRVTHGLLWLTLAVLAALEFRLLSGVAAAGQGVILAVSPWRYLLTQGGVILHYLRLTFWPTGLCLDYGWPLAVVGPAALVAVAAVGGMGIVTVIGLLRRAPWAFCGAWFFGILAPSSSFMAVPDVAADHRMYLPLAGLICLVACGAGRFLERRKGAYGIRLLMIAGVGVVVLLGAQTIRRGRDYRGTDVMWADVVAKRPHNHRARINLANRFLDAGRLVEAEDQAGAVLDDLMEYRDAAAASIPDWGRNTAESIRYREARYYVLAHNVSGVAKAKRGDLNGAGAHFEEALRLLPSFRDAQENLARVRAATGPENTD